MKTRITSDGLAWKFGVLSLFVAVGFLSGCATQEQRFAPTNVEAVKAFPDEVDPAIYARVNDPMDPFRAKYAEFRERRARDMASADSPRALDRYPAFHRSEDQPWSNLEKVIAFDGWESIRSKNTAEAEALAESVRMRVVFDHPDLKITQVIVGAGGLLPAHAGGAPAAYIVVGGRGEVFVDGETQRVTPGSTVRLVPYAVRRVAASKDEPLRLLWIRWAPGGDQAYIDAGYYLTGANQHIQPKQATIQDPYRFWGEVNETMPLEAPTRPIKRGDAGSIYAQAERGLAAAREALGETRDPYPDVPIFGHESRRDWLSAETMRKGGFFFSDDLASLGPVADRMIQIARHKAIFRATRPDGRWDFNFSQSAWGARATYVEHSHVIPEFYYILSGPVIYGVDGVRHRSLPGDILFNNSYSPHLAQGIVDGLVFNSFSSTFAPNGDRSVFERKSFVIEPLPSQPSSARLATDVPFHPLR